MALKPTRTTAPTSTPVSLDEVKAHLRIDHTDEDALLGIYLQAATDYLDGAAGILGKAIVTQTWSQVYGTFADPLALPATVAPVQSIDEITYYDGDNALQTLDVAVYELVTNDICGARVVLATDQSWPTTYTRDDAVSVAFVAGYGTPDAVPATIRQAMLLLIGDWYGKREASTQNEMYEMPFAVRALLTNVRLPVI